LQELPKPVTKLTWDNAVMMSPRTALRFGISYPSRTGFQPGQPGPHGGEHGEAIVDMVELTYRDQTIHAPVWLVPGHADSSITIHMGYGRRRAGRVGTGLGFSAFDLMHSEAPRFDRGARVRRLDKTMTLACTQMHHGMQGREPVKA